MSDEQITQPELRKYEIMFLVGGDKSQETVTEISQTVRQEITSRGGAITREDVWGLREMSYPLRRQTHGHYTVFTFDLPGNKVSDLNKHLLLNTSVLRFLITTLPENYKFLTHEELQEHGKKRKPAGKEADTIRAEGVKMRRPSRTTAPRSARPPIQAMPAVEKPAPVVQPVIEKPQPPAVPTPPQPPMSEEDRLKELDRQLEKLIKEDDI